MSKILTGLMALALAIPALAQTPMSVGFQGIITDPDGSSPTVSGTSVTLKVLSPNRCILWEEQHTGVNISDGYINLAIGQGVTGGAQPAGQTFMNVFSNASPQTGLTCLNLDGTVNGAVTTYVPTPQDERGLRVETTLPSGAISPEFHIRSLPYAIVAATADSAKKVGTKAESDLLAVNASVGLTQTNLEAFIQSLTSISGRSVKWDGSNFTSYDPADGANLTAGSVPGSAIVSLPWSKLTSIPSPLADIGALACADGKIIKKVSGSWVCADESGVGTEVDPTVQAFAQHAPGTGLLVNGSNAIVPDFGTGAGKVVEGNDSRLSDSRAPSGSAGGELGGTYPNPTVAKLAGVTLNVSSLTSGQVLKYDGTNWVNATDAGVAAETDPTVQAFAQHAPGTGLVVNGSNEIVPDFGTGAGKVVQGNDSRLSDSRAPSGTAGGDLGGNYPNPTVNQLRGQPVSATTPTADQVLVYTGGTWAPTTFGIQNLKTSLGANQFSAGNCSANQTLNWSAITDAFSCVNINNLDGGKITTGTVAFARLPTGTSSSTVAVGNDSRFPSSTCASGNKMRWDGSVWQCEADANAGGTISSLTGDVTGSGTGAVSTTISNEAITDAKVSSSAAIAWSKISKSGAAASDVGAVANAGGAPSIQAGVDGSKPGFGTAGRLYVATDTKKIYYDTGAAWIVISTTAGADISGSISGNAANVTGTVAVANGGTGVTSLSGTFVLNGGQAGAVTLGSTDSNSVTVKANNSAALTILSNGNVGIGTTTSNYKLAINGAAGNASSISNASGTIDFSTGNLQYTTNSCGAFNLNNMKDGASYTFAVQGATSATCSFAAYSDAGTTALTVHMPTDHAATTVSKHTLYNFIVLGSHVYVAWSPGL